MTALCGFFAACLLWGLRHIVERAFFESGEGWKESLYGPTPEKKAR
ncbi:MAG: hypothetical protein JWL90_957 [Chthoniobacteraceae bacterium]|nr:hypothetical protein [Chthoniobacteraceae bacterium]